jgi:hypothetical protein
MGLKIIDFIKLSADAGGGVGIEVYFDGNFLFHGNLNNWNT